MLHLTAASLFYGKLISSFNLPPPLRGALPPLRRVAYVLIEHLRRSYLKGTKWAKAQVDTIRLKLFKIGAVITKNTRKILFALSSAYPDQDLFIRLILKMNSS